MQRKIEPYSYKIEKDGEVYVAKSDNLHIDEFQEIRNDLSLDRLVKRNLFSWRSSKRLINLEDIPLLKWCRASSFEYFYTILSCSIHGNHPHIELSYSDAELFFRKMYEHYKNLTSNTN